MKGSTTLRWQTGPMAVMLCLTLVSCAAIMPTPRQRITLIGPEISRDFSVEIARTEAERERGLMGRTELKTDEGMLFVFTDEPERRLQFWMKNTLIPLDAMFFDADGVFVSVATMEPCAQDPCPLYPSLRPAAYVLEVPAGQAEAMGLRNDFTPEERARWHLEVPESLRDL